MANAAQCRELSFNSLDEVVSEVERLAAIEVRTTGKHSFPQILNHLALSQDVSTGRATAPSPPFYMKLVMPLMKRMVINDKPLKPGINLPAAGESFFWPDQEFDLEEMVRYFKESTDHYLRNGPLQKHPFFGVISPEQDLQLNCRHAALHLSFVHPVSSES